MLNEEKSSDDALRAQFKERWSRLASEKLTDPLWQEIGKFKGILETATAADGIVRGKFAKCRDAIELLSRPEPDLKAAIPAASGANAGANASAVGELRQLMAEVDAMCKERMEMERQLKDVKCDMCEFQPEIMPFALLAANTFLKAMAESSMLDERALSESKLVEIYTPLRAKVTDSVHQQESLVGRIQQANNRFVGDRSSTDAARERERVLKMLATGHDSFVELKSNLQEGTKV